MVIGCYSMEVRPYLSKSALIVCNPDKVQERPKENDKEYLYIYNSFLNKNTLKESKEPQSTIVQHFLAHLSQTIKWDFLISVYPLSVVAFSSSFPEPPGRFHLNLEQSITWPRGFKFVRIKGHTLLKGEIIRK